jgi:hypothetical protein
MAGYSGTPLIQKLGIKPGYQIHVANEPRDYWDWISPLPEKVVTKKSGAKGLDFIHLFVTRRKVFEKEVLKHKKSLKPDGMIWISWPKKSSKVPSDMDENIVRDFALKNGLVDVKVCAVDDVWSGLKLVIPVKDRPRK